MRGVATLGAALAVLASPAAAAAHVEPAPTFAAAGSTTTVDFTGPNERNVAMTGFALRLPDDLGVLSASGPPGWRWEIVDGDVLWTGGSLAPAEEATFSALLAFPSTPGRVTVEAEQRYPGGEVVSWQVPLTVVPGAATTSESRTFPLVLGLASLVCVLVVTMAFRRRRQRPVR